MGRDWNLVGEFKVMTIIKLFGGPHVMRWISKLYEFSGELWNHEILNDFENLKR